MFKRLCVIAIWAYAGWAFGSFVATWLVLSPILGPVIGLAAGAAIAVGKREQHAPAQ